MAILMSCWVAAVVSSPHTWQQREGQPIALRNFISGERDIRSRGGELHLFTTSCHSQRYAANALAMIRSVYDGPTTRRGPVHVHVWHDNATAVQQGLIRPIRGLFAHGLLQRERMRVTFALTTVPEHMRYRFKVCATARLLIGKDHPHISTAIYIDSDSYVARTLPATCGICGE